jgi:hypothetical protein
VSDTINQATLDRYLETSPLTDAQKDTLQAEFKTKGGARSVLDKAVQLSGRKSMTKVPCINTK